jgi:hypothetical protein
LKKDLLVCATGLNRNGLKLLNIADDLLLYSEVKHLGGNEYEVPSTVSFEPDRKGQWQPACQKEWKKCEEENE